MNGSKTIPGRMIARSCTPTARRRPRRRERVVGAPGPASGSAARAWRRQGTAAGSDTVHRLGKVGAVPRCGSGRSSARRTHELVEDPHCRARRRRSGVCVQRKQAQGLRRQPVAERREPRRQQLADHRPEPDRLPNDVLRRGREHSGHRDNHRAPTRSSRRSSRSTRCFRTSRSPRATKMHRDPPSEHHGPHLGGGGTDRRRRLVRTARVGDESAGRSARGPEGTPA